MSRSLLRAVTLAALLALVAPLTAAAHADAAQPWMDRGLSPDRRADLVAARLTQPERIRLVTGLFVCLGGGDGYVAGVPRLGIPSLTLIGAGMGVTDLCGPLGPSATELPAPIALAAGWDPDTAQRDGALIGAETRALGMEVSLSGDVNLARDPRNGRTFEAAGEDPLLAGRITAAQLRGIQSQHIVATIKHFAANNGETYRFTQSSEVDERTLRELELRAFEIGIRDSGVGAVMCAYNKLNGTPTCANRWLLNDVLRDDWKFQGWVMSDWWACAPPTVWNPANQCQTVPAALAGLDQEQPNASFFGPALRTAVALRQVPQATLDRMVHRILRTLFAVGLIDDPPVRGSLDADAGARVAEDVATRTAVLLKNDHDLLPLDRGDVRTLAVIGAPADAAPPQGTTGSAVVKPLAADTPLEGLRDVAPGVRLVYVDGRDPAAAAAAARDADGAVVYARDREHEGADRPDLSLDGDADALIATVAAANPRTAVVLMTGSAVTMPWLADVPAVLEAWYPGERGGHAIAHLLFGDANPSGRLPLTFPAALGDLPTAGSPDQWPGDAQHVVYREGLRLGYRHYDAAGIAPLFAFGHGLSYGGRSRYGDLEARADAVSFTLTNDGDRTATEVPQVYVGLPAATGEPPQRLAGWARVTLGPGESRRVTVTLDDRARDVWDTTAGRWRTVTGSVTVTVGASSRDPRLHGVLPG